jgi:hypothetical protein
LWWQLVSKDKIVAQVVFNCPLFPTPQNNSATKWPMTQEFLATPLQLTFLYYITSNIFLFERASKTTGAMKLLFLFSFNFSTENRYIWKYTHFFRVFKHFFETLTFLFFFHISTNIFKKRALIGPAVFDAFSNKKNLYVQRSSTENFCKEKELFLTIV